MALISAPPKVKWWTTLILFFAFLLLPGADRSFFGGAPLSARGVALFFLTVLLATFTALYPPTLAGRWRWTVLLAVAIGVKLALAPMLVSTGWKAEYWTSKSWTKTGTTLRQATFLSKHGIRPYRVDRAIDFEGLTFGMSFLNDPAPPAAEYLPEPRDVYFPLRVVWEGWTETPPGQVIPLQISAAGSMTITVDGKRLISTRNPANLSVTLPASQISQRHVVVEYEKPFREKPLAAVRGLSTRITPQPTSAATLRTSDWVARGISLTGLIAIAALALTFFSVNPRMSAFALGHIWSSPTKIAAFVFFAAFVLLGVARTIPERHGTILESLGDDPLFYESSARLILREGLLMADPQRPPGPYYFYPFYSYALAGAHLLMGDDFATVSMFNYVCIASLGLLFWALLRNRVSSGPGIVVLLALAWLVTQAMFPYVRAAFTDNLYLPLTLSTLVICVAALEKRKLAWLWFAGLLTALATATRPSFLFFLPLFGLWLLYDRDIGPISRRVKAGLNFGLGFGCGVAPFTLRNWIVSGRLVLIVSSYVMLPLFLLPPEEPSTGLFKDGRPPGLVESIQMAMRIVSERPLDVLWLETRKVLFTLGLTTFGPAQVDLPDYFVLFPILFGLALWSKRIPRNLRNVILVFAVSHMIAMVVAAPYSYGYKNILPLHVVCLLTAAFLMPNWGEQRLRVPIPHRIDSRAKNISVVLPTYKEKDSIRGVILDFFATGVVQEVVVINNNAVAGTSEEVAGTGAREIFEPRQGYGAAIRRGLREAKGDYIVLCEPDGTFVASDIHKLIAYADDFDAVYGSRTSQEFVWHGANMGLFLRWGNIAVAKYIAFLYNATSLTDVGCTLRLVRREVAETLADQFRIDGSQFGPEMMILSIRAGYRVVQIPVNYRERVGVSAVTGDPAKAFWLGLQMIWLITSRRFEDLVVRRPSVTTRETTIPTEPLRP